jgi:peroxiredoxin
MKALIACLFLASTLPAAAALKPGAPAPDFTIPATQGGKEFTFRLADALKKGPVVVYFYPAAFTKGCSLEAREFAEAMPQYQARGASVIGVSNDKIETLNKFSVSECQSKFPVGADTDRKVMRSYDASLGFLTGMASRTSYVISQDGKIAFVHSDMDPQGHVSKTLKAVSDLKR